MLSIAFTSVPRAIRKNPASPHEGPQEFLTFCDTNQKINTSNHGSSHTEMNPLWANYLGASGSELAQFGLIVETATHADRALGINTIMMENIVTQYLSPLAASVP